MKKCPQCGSDYPLSNNSCPHCGYGESAFANNTNMNNTVNQISNTTNKNAKIIKIVIIVMAIIVLIMSIGIFAFSKFIFNNISDLAEQELNNGFNTSTAEECSSRCDGSYVYMNGTCSCVNVNFE